MQRLDNHSSDVIIRFIQMNYTLFGNYKGQFKMNWVLENNCEHCLLAVIMILCTWGKQVSTGGELTYVIVLKCEAFSKLIA